MSANYGAVPLDTLIVVIYCLVAAAGVCIVRRFGPFSLSSYCVEDEYDSEGSKENISYRILAPSLFCIVVVLLANGLIGALRGELGTLASFVPTLMYWVILSTIKASHHKLWDRVGPYLIEAFLSCLISFAADCYVIGAVAKEGLAVFDQSSIAFQLEVALFWALVGVISTLFLRRRYRVRVGGAAPAGRTRVRSYRYYTVGTVDTSEKRLASYEQRFGKNLPVRYKQDILLRALFFSIMAIEDSNRPEGVRMLERVLCRFGLASTTGIMQQKSARPLSDGESASLAAEYICGMWDGYLRAYAKSGSATEAEDSISFTGRYYSYDFQTMRSSIEKNFSLLYGDYCATRLLNANYVFREVLAYELRNNYGLSTTRVMAAGSIFPHEAMWFGSREFCWNDSCTVRLFDRPDVLQGVFLVKRDEGTSADEVDELLRIVLTPKTKVWLVQVIEDASLEVCLSELDCDEDELGKLGWEVASE